MMDSPLPGHTPVHDVLDFRRMLDDADYMGQAIDRLAWELSMELMETQSTLMLIRPEE